MSSSDPVSVSATSCQLVGGSSVLVSSTDLVFFSSCSATAKKIQYTFYRHDNVMYAIFPLKVRLIGITAQDF